MIERRWRRHSGKADNLRSCQYQLEKAFSFLSLENSHITRTNKNKWKPIHKQTTTNSLHENQMEKLKRKWERFIFLSETSTYFQIYLHWLRTERTQEKKSGFKSQFHHVPMWPWVICKLLCSNYLIWIMRK